ncbi:MAG: efflux RND transporter permease subunit [Proteobacteria bacterium]|nr:efflux RND transporter permease subunit [Pseudomonadota bacterium]
MQRLVAACVRYAGPLTALTLIALLAGLWSLRTAPLDVFPDFVPSTVDIQTEAPGMTAEQVEQLVTRPIENAVNGATGLATLRSQSIPGLSVITIQFLDKIDLYNARQGIAERLGGLASSLPLGTGTPKLSPLTSSTMDLLKIGLRSASLDAFALRDEADWTLKPALLAVPGVARVSVFGGAVRQLQIQPDPRRLAAYAITLTELADAARAALALKGAGFIDLAHQRVLIQTPIPAPDPALLGRAVVVVRSGTPVMLAEVATVRELPALMSGDALIQGKPGILLTLATQYGANTLEVTHAVEAALAQLAPQLRRQGIELFPRLHRPANFIEAALASLRQSLLVAALLILAVLYGFLRDWRSALIIFLAIPLSLLSASLALRGLGDTLNTMTLGGFAVALGVLVDDAIIGVENILRRLAENARAAAPRPRAQVIVEASVEVRAPVLYATLVVIAVFLPELFSTSIQGRFVGPLALSFILAVLASLLLALTVAPALSALLLKAPATHGGAAWIGRLKQRQSRSIAWVHRHFRAVVPVLAALSLAALALLPFLSASLMPDFRENHFVMRANAATPGASLQELRTIGVRLSEQLLALPYVATVSQQIGRAELGEDINGPHQSEFHVELKSGAHVDQLRAEDEIRDLAARIPGLSSEVTTFLGDRISESLTGESADVSVRVFGNDLAVLDSVARRIAVALGAVPGIADLQYSPQSATPTLSVQLDRTALAAVGLQAADVLEALRSHYAGVVLGQTFRGIRSIDVVMLLAEQARNRLESLDGLLVNSPLGPVPLGQVARIVPTDSRYLVSHESGQRLASVTFNVSGRSLGATTQEAARRIGALQLPAGVVVRFAGAGEAEKAARSEMLLHSALALLLIGLILFSCLGWRANTWLVMLNLPFSLIGSVAAIALLGGLSLGAMVGLVTVFGISARNAILLLSHYEHLVGAEGAAWDAHTVVRGAQERLIPILMTAAVTALGLLPLAWGLKAPGQEIEGPMAVTVLGGLVSSTVLNLIVLPALCERWGGPPERPS